MIEIFFQTVVLYLWLVFVLRISGKRTLSRWNSFDFIVNVALGSTLAASVINSPMRFWQGLLALATLVLLQFMITKLVIAFPFLGDIVKSEPAILFRHGQFIDERMKRERIPHSEIYSAVRSHGFYSLDQVEFVVLETDGSFSVIPHDSKADARLAPSALQDIREGLDKIDAKENTR